MEPAMPRHPFITTLLLALTLSACASMPSAPGVQQSLRAHTECPAARYDSAVWTPDGQSILYDIRIGVTVDIRQMDANGSNDRMLIPHAEHPQISPGPGGAGDSSLLLYEPPTTTPGEPHSYFLFDMKTGRLREAIKLAYGALWAADGRQVVYISAGRVVKANVLTGQTVPITHTAGGGAPGSGMATFDDSPMGSPDGSRIAFWSNAPDVSGSLSAPHIAIVGVDGGAITALPVSPDPSPMCRAPGSGVFLAGWRPDSKALTLYQTCAGSQWLRVITLDGREVSNWAAVDDQTVDAQWSPDGSRLALTTGNATGGARSSVLARADGSGVTFLPSSSTSPRWSPDSRRIVFEGEDSLGLSEIFTANADGSHVEQLTQNPGASGVCLH